MNGASIYQMPDAVAVEVGVRAASFCRLPSARQVAAEKARQGPAPGRPTKVGSPQGRGKLHVRHERSGSRMLKLLQRNATVRWRQANAAVGSASPGGREAIRNSAGPARPSRSAGTPPNAKRKAPSPLRPKRALRLSKRLPSSVRSGVPARIGNEVRRVRAWPLARRDCPVDAERPCQRNRSARTRQDRCRMGPSGDSLRPPCSAIARPMHSRSNPEDIACSGLNASAAKAAKRGHFSLPMHAPEIQGTLPEIDVLDAGDRRFASAAGGLSIIPRPRGPNTGSRPLRGLRFRRAGAFAAPRSSRAEAAILFFAHSLRTARIPGSIRRRRQRGRVVRA